MEWNGCKDLRKERIFTIDPSNAKDMDDTLSIKLNPEGTASISTSAVTHQTGLVQ